MDIVKDGGKNRNDTAVYESSCKAQQPHVQWQGQGEICEAAATRSSFQEELDERAQINDSAKSQGDPDMMFGIGSWRPQCLQIFANFKFAFFLLCVSGFLFMVDFSCFIAGLTSVQKRYSLDSTLVGLNATMFDTATLISVVFVSFFYGQQDSHRPRVIGLSLIFAASFQCLTSLPHFLSGTYRYSSVVIGTNDTTLCSGSNGNSSGEILGNMSDICSMIDERESMQAAVLSLLGNFFLGMSFTPLTILISSYIDDGAGKLKAPLYLGIYHTIENLGIVIGFPISSLFIDLYVDFDRVNMSSIDIDPNDTRWVGAWWLGYLVNGTLTLVIGIPIMLLPKRFSPPRENDAMMTAPSIVTSCDDSDTIVEREAIRRFKEFPSAVRRLFSNVPLMSISIAFGCETAILSGLLTYSPKYIENQFRVSAATAALMTGIVFLLSSSLGILTGGVLMRYLKLSPLVTAKALVVFGVITLLLPIPLLFLGCEQDSFAGVSVPYSDLTNSSIRNSSFINFGPSQFVSACNLNCGCSVTEYDPVCGIDGLTYKSPCFAGCTEAITKENFNSCGCIGPISQHEEGGTAVGGICGKSCWGMFEIFIVFSSFASFVSAVPITAYIMLPLRVVTPEDKPFALGIRQFFAEVIGWVPTPVYMGYVIDSACLFWGVSECSIFSTCWNYDLFDYRLKMMIFEIVLKACALTMYLVLWLSLSKKAKELKSSGQDSWTEH